MLKHTDLLPTHGLKGIFVGATYGGPLNEAALAGEVDVIFTADQPAVALLARGADWTIIGRLMFNRVGIYVPPDSPIKELAQLKGKNVAMPFGAAAQRVALKAIGDAGLDPNKDINAINLNITEQAGVIDRGTSSSWGEIDPMVGFDPTVAILEKRGKARMLHVGNVTSLIVMDNAFIRKNPKAPTQFLKAFKAAVYYYATHQEEAGSWFLQDSQLTFDQDVLTLAASVEPNLDAGSTQEVEILLSQELIEGIQEAADFIFDKGLVKKKLKVSDHIDMSHAHAANEEIANEAPKTTGTAK